MSILFEPARIRNMMLRNLCVYCDKNLEALHHGTPLNCVAFAAKAVNAPDERKPA